METRFIRNGVIKTLAIISVLLQATYSENATNSSATNLTTTNSSTIKNSTSTISVTSLNSTENLESSKKDKRQAQRGYTDIPLDERSFDDVTNSSPAPFQGFENQLPPLAEKPNNDLSSSSSSSNYLPNLVNSKLSFDSSYKSPRLGFPANLPKFNDDVPAAAATIIERRDDFFDTSGDGKPIPGEAGRDYPIFASIPRTSFSCKDQPWPGYYADTEARCQVFWICQKHRMDAFLCPNGTLFNQQVFVCDWWFNVDCNTAPEFYSRNQFLYSGPGVGIDGQPTRSRGLPQVGNFGAATNSFGNAVIPRPIEVNSNNAYVNQVQSSNQIARVASVGPSQVSRQQSPPPSPASSYNDNQHHQNYLASPSQQFQQKYPNPNQNQQHTSSSSSQKFISNQNMLSNRMQKSQSNPTSRPVSHTTDNSFTGGYQQQIETRSQYQQSPPNDVNRRTFSSPEQNQVIVEYHTNRSVSTTQRPEFVSIQTSSRPVNSNNIPRLNVNIEPKGSQQAIVTFSGTISSTARPVSINTEIPSYNHGSSTLQTPKDFGNSNQFNQQQLKQNGGYQDYNNNNHNGPQVTTSAPITTTFRSTSTTYSTNMRVGVVPHNPPPQSSPNPNNIGNRQFGSIGSLHPPTGTPSPKPALINNVEQPGTNYGHTGFVPVQTTPIPVTSTLRPPGPDLDHQHYVDRFGVVQNTQTNQRVFVSSTTPQPLGYSNTASPELILLGQRSNQYTNYNGQREIMYSPSSINTNIEYPYSPSQQKNKQRRLELESLKSFRTLTKDLFAYPHFHGQRSNAYSEPDGEIYRAGDNKINVDYQDQSTPQTHPYHQLPGENVHPSNAHPPAHTTPQPRHSQNHQNQNLPVHLPTQQNVQYNFGTPTAQPSRQNVHNFGTPTPQPQFHQNVLNNFGTPSPPPQQNVPQNFATPSPHPQQQNIAQNFGTPTQHPQQNFAQNFDTHVPHPQQNVAQNFGTPASHPQQNVAQNFGTPVLHPQQNVAQNFGTPTQQSHQNIHNFGTPTPQPQQNFPQNFGTPIQHQQQSHQNVPQLGSFHSSSPQNNQQRHQNLQGHHTGQPQPVYQPTQQPSGSINVAQVQPQNPNNNQRQVHPQHQQYHQQTEPQPNFHHQQNNQQNLQNHQLSPDASHSTPFHQRIIQLPSQNLQLPSPEDYTTGSRNGFTALKSGSFISIATTSSPAFSQQILSLKPHEQPIDSKHSKHNLFPSPTPPPNGLNYFPSPKSTSRKQRTQSVHLSTLRPPPPNSTPSPFTNDEFTTFSKQSSSSSSNNATPTPFTNQNSFIAAPTQSSVSSTSPGHRQNPYLPHNHGKSRNKQSNNQKQTQNHGIQYPNSVITTTIKYPEGTGSLKLGVPGATNTKRLVDYSYSANPKSTTKSSIKTTPFPTVGERFNNIVVSSTRRPQSSPSSPSPQYSGRQGENSPIHHRKGARLAGAVLNKSTSSSTAIYVDSSATAESVSTPVSVPLPPSPEATVAPAAVSTSNFGLRISTMAKKKMANAWQNYFGSGEKASSSSQQDNSTT